VPTDPASNLDLQMRKRLAVRWAPVDRSCVRVSGQGSKTKPLASSVGRGNRWAPDHPGEARILGAVHVRGEPDSFPAGRYRPTSRRTSSRRHLFYCPAAKSETPIKTVGGGKGHASKLCVHAFVLPQLDLKHPEPMLSCIVWLYLVHYYDLLSPFQKNNAS
jgi:hypothetical protein